MPQAYTSKKSIFYNIFSNLCKRLTFYIQVIDIVIITMDGYKCIQMQASKFRNLIIFWKYRVLCGSEFHSYGPKILRLLVAKVSLLRFGILKLGLFVMKRSASCFWLINLFHRNRILSCLMFYKLQCKEIYEDVDSYYVYGSLSITLHRSFHRHFT